MEKNKTGDFIHIRCTTHKRKIEKAKFLQKKRDNSLIKIPVTISKKKLFEVISYKEHYNSNNELTRKQNIDLTNPKNDMNPPILKLRSNYSFDTTSHNSTPVGKLKVFNVIKSETIESITERSDLAEEKKYLNIPSKEMSLVNMNNAKSSIISKNNFSHNEEIKSKIIPTQINFHNNTFNFGNSYENRSKLNLDDKIIKDKLNLNINNEKSKKENLNINIDKEFNNEKDKKTNESSKLDLKSKNTLIDKFDVMKKTNLKNLDIVFNKKENPIIELNNGEKRIPNNKSELASININKINKSDSMKNEFLNINNSRMYIRTPKTNEKVFDLNEKINLKKDYIISRKNEKLENPTLIKEDILIKANTKIEKSKSNEGNINLDEEKITGKTKSIPQIELKSLSLDQKLSHQKMEVSNHPINERYFIKPELAKILNIYFPVTLTELLSKFKSYLLGKNIVENNEYILLFKDQKLKELFNTEFLKLSDLKEKLFYFIERIEKKNLKRDLEKPKVLSENFSKNHLLSEIVNEKEYEKNLSGWRIQKEKEIDTRELHRLDIIIRRSFFKKDECFKLVKFQL